MTEPIVTVVVVPRERFSRTEASLESILANTAPEMPLVYVDGNTPARVRRYLEGRAREKGFRILRTEYYLTPNEARNLSLAAVDTKYVAFLDNDVEVSPGWLEALVGCAEETGAWVVAPIYCWEGGIVHTADGEAGIEESDGVRKLYENHRFVDEKLSDIHADLHRRSTNIAEYHALLIRTDVFEKLGPLDETLKGVHEHIDFSFQVLAAGGSIYFEPAAVVAYIRPPPVTWSDTPFFVLRWSDAWCLATFRRMNEKWGLEDDHYGIYHRFVRPRRAFALAALRRWARRLLGEWLGGKLVAAVERRIIAHGRRRRRALKAA